MSLLNYPNLWMMVAVIVACAAVCDRVPWIRRRSVVIGLVMGCSALFCGITGRYLPDLDVFISIRDAAVMISALLFGPIAALVTTLLSLVGRFAMVVYHGGEGADTLLSYALGTVFVMGYGIAAARYICFRTRPGILMLAVLTGLAEVVLYAFLMIVFPNENIEAFFATADVEAVFKMLCGLGAGIVCKSSGLLSDKSCRINAVILLLFLFLLDISYYVAIEILASMDLEMLGVVSRHGKLKIGNGTIPYLMEKSALLMEDAAVKGGEAPPQKRLLELAKTHQLAGITLLDGQGRLIGSSRKEMADAALRYDFIHSRLMQLAQSSKGDACERYFLDHVVPDGKNIIVVMRRLPGRNALLFVSLDAEFQFSHFDMLGLPDANGVSLSSNASVIILRKSDMKIVDVSSSYKEHLNTTLALPPDMEFPEADGQVDLRIFGKSCHTHIQHVGDYVFMTILPYADVYLPIVYAYIIILALFAVVFSVIGVLAASRREDMKKQEKMRKEAERRRTEDMATASSIQMSAMPNVFPPFPWDLTLDLYATMHPAWEVGGDFYDFYYLNQCTFAVVMADVSGKGIPAAMFMMRAKSTIKSSVMMDGDLGKAMTEANKLLYQDNVAEMFVTCWVGLFHTDSGMLEYVNAGHNAPYVRHADGTLTPLSTVSGLFLAGLDDTTYTSSQTSLLPGDVLFLYTDGVTEANDKSKKMFGEERLEETLMAFESDSDDVAAHGQPCMLCSAVNKAVCNFMAEEPQFDDMTMLALLYRGQPRHEQLEVAAALENVPQVTSFLENNLKCSGCPDDTCSELLIAMDEIFSNVIRYSGSPMFRLDINVIPEQKIVTIICTDSGKPYNPLAAPPPDLTLDGDERVIGGLGIFIVKNLMDNLYYTYLNNQNVLHLLKRF